MRFADDRRARVPFALVGVLLLTGSLALAATVSTRRSPDAASPTGDALRETTGAARTALHRAVRVAARNAAESPVVAPANTTYGRALDGDQPFRDALRLRIYLQARRALQRVGVARADVVATANLPAVTDTESASEAVERVQLTPADGGRALRVRVRNLTVRVARGGAVVERQTYSPRVSVATPVLALHRNVTRFEDRLSERGALGSRLLSRLTAMAWVRGFAQWGGAPIGNVVANRHVALAANGAVLALQRAVFGTSDGRGRAAMDAAVRRTALTDLGGAAPGGAPPTDGPVPDTIPSAVQGRDGPAFDRPLHVGVNATADRAYAGLLGTGGVGSIDGVMERAFQATVRVRSRVETVAERTDRDGTAPAGADPDAVDRNRRTTLISDRRVSDVSGPTLAAYRRTVRVVTRTVRRYDRQTGTRTVETVRRERIRVRIDVDVRYGPTLDVPVRPYGAAPLPPEQMASLRRRVRETVRTDFGGVDGLARRAAIGRAPSAQATLPLEPPAGTRRAVLASLARARDRLRRVSVTVDRRRLLSASPADRLRDAVNETRAAVVDVPAQYPNLTTRASVAARRLLVRGVTRRLAARAEDGRESRARLRDEFEGLATGPLAPPVSGSASDSVARVRATPAFLTLSAVDAPGGRYRPLAVRNVDLGGLPTGEVLNGALSGLTGDGEGVSLRAAGRLLAATRADWTGRDVANATPALRSAVNDSLRGVRRRLDAALERGTALSAAERRRLLRGALREWERPASRVEALVDGRLTGRLAALAARRSSTHDAVLESRLRVSALDAREAASTDVAAPVVSRVAGRVRRAARGRLEDLAARGVRKARRRLLRGPAARLPAGVPVTPVPGQWYATVDAWNASARGRYARFAVSRPGPGAHGRNVTYVRRDATVSLDVDGDGSADVLGRNRALRFAVSVPVLVAVPPGPSGVGDVTGKRDERSAGWNG